MPICAHCGQVVTYRFQLAPVHMLDGTVELWCDECLEHDAHQCDHCREYFENDSDFECVRVHFWRNVWEDWCPDCVNNHAERCSSCDELFSSDYIYHRPVWGGGRVTLCDSCLDNYYRTCHNCGCTVSEEDAVWSGGNYYCPDHVPSENVHSYHHTEYDLTYWLNVGLGKYRSELTSDERKTLFLGVELETDDNDSRDALADDIMREYSDEYVECKRDGSLGPQGLEIVSMPMTPKVQLTMGMWERITEIVKNHGGKSHEAGTCGLHVHLSRDYFHGKDPVYRLDRLFHRFERELLRFSRRTRDQLEWCEFDDGLAEELVECPCVEDRKAIWSDKKNNRYRARYQAVNDTNWDTVEIRLWRGTLNVETLRATIELTTALAIIANTMSDELAEGLTWNMLKVLARYALEAEGLPHNDLDSYLVRRGL